MRIIAARAFGNKHFLVCDLRPYNDHIWRQIAGTKDCSPGSRTYAACAAHDDTFGLRSVVGALIDVDNFLLRGHTPVRGCARVLHGVGGQRVEVFRLYAQFLQRRRDAHLGAQALDGGDCLIGRLGEVRPCVFSPNAFAISTKRSMQAMVLKSSTCGSSTALHTPCGRS